MFAVIFLCGIAFGSVITSTYLHGKIVHASAPSGLGDVAFAQLKRQLNLTPDQEKTVAKELDDYAKYYQNIQDELDDVASHGKQRILSVLTPEQQKKFNEIFGSGRH